VKRGAELEIALFAVVELPRGLERPQAFAFAFDQHQQFVGDLVLGAHRQRAPGSGQYVFLQIEFCHDCLLHKCSGSIARPTGRALTGGACQPWGRKSI
jgi:hypothetical protein